MNRSRTRVRTSPPSKPASAAKRDREVAAVGGHQLAAGRRSARGRPSRAVASPSLARMRACIARGNTVLYGSSAARSRSPALRRRRSAAAAPAPAHAGSRTPTLRLARVGVAALVVASGCRCGRGRRRRGSRTARSRSSGRGSTCCRCSSRRGRSRPPAIAPSARPCAASPLRAARAPARARRGIRGSSSSMTKSASRRSASMSCAVCVKCSKWPKRMKLGATRVTTAAVSIVSRRTGSGEPVTHSARVVGMPSACIASEHRNSRIDERSTARPSPMREYGVRPLPLSCSSMRAGRRVDFAEQQRAPVAELAGPDAELVAAVDAGQRVHAGPRRVAARKPPALPVARHQSACQPERRGASVAGGDPVRVGQRQRRQAGVEDDRRATRSGCASSAGQAATRVAGRRSSGAV